MTKLSNQQTYNLIRLFLLLIVFTHIIHHLGNSLWLWLLAPFMYLITNIDVNKELEEMGE